MMYHKKCGSQVTVVHDPFGSNDGYYCSSCSGSFKREDVVSDIKLTDTYVTPVQQAKKKKKWVKCPDCQGRGWYDRATMEKLHIEGGDGCRNCGGTGRCLE